MKRKTTREEKMNLLRRVKREKRTRATLRGTAERPRLTVFRSGKHIRAQLIDDTAGRTLLGVDDRKIKKEKGGSKVVIAEKTGSLLAERARQKGVRRVVFDRGAYRYHGRVRALAEGARKGGLSF